MGSLCPHANLTVLLVFILLALCLPISNVKGQVPAAFRKLFDTTASSDRSTHVLPNDSVLKAEGIDKLVKRINPFASFQKLLPKPDSLVADTAKPNSDKVQKLLATEASNVYKSIMPLDEIRDLIKKDSSEQKKKFLHTIERTNSKHLLAVTGGYISYNFNYRSTIDTPFLETGIYQNQVSGNFDVLVADQLPFTVSYLGRQSNSNFYKDIADVQVSFNSNAFQNGLVSKMRNRLGQQTEKLLDTLSEKLYVVKNDQLEALKNKLRSSFSPQRLGEAHEIVSVPELSYDPNLPDSVNRLNADSLQFFARKYLESCEKTKASYERVSKQVDSLKDICLKNVSRIKRYRETINNPGELYQSGEAIRALKAEYNLSDTVVPVKYLKYMNVRSASIGRTPLNYSELTAKNVNLNGINFEYNSWYYFAVAAGFVDYRFREFATARHLKPRAQTFYQLRLGLGKLDKSNIIVSAFRGKKQLFTSRTNNPGLINISGLSLEGRLALNRNTYIKGEVANSFAPDLRLNQSGDKNENVLGSRDNSAYSISAYSYIPLSNTRLEGSYKSTGANYQSFTNFQTSTALESWYIKADQVFLNYRIRLSGYVRKNDFSNPFLAIPYNSNTVFKAINLSLRLPRFPVITVGYQPMSQLTVLDQQVFENRFQSFTASAFHSYRLKALRTTSNIVINKFYNDSRDTGYIYYNATNLLFSQHFYFPKFTSNIGVNVTGNPGYLMTVLEAGIEPVVTSRLSFGLGVRINTINEVKSKVGGFLNANILLFKGDQLSIGYEHGYLPGNVKSLVRNEMGSVQFIKTLKFN